MTDVTVVVPTYNRGTILLETLRRLSRQETSASFEVVVVDDGSSDGSARRARQLANALPLPATVLEQRNSGPAAARNRALSVACGRVTLFIGDDTWPHPDLLARHAAFHARRPEPEAALVGRVTLARESRPSPLMEWWGEAQWRYDRIEDVERVPASFFFTSNVSAKTAYLREHRGFDEAFRSAACEDLELGARLERAGMRLVWDPDAIVEHYHPVDLPALLARLDDVGHWLRLLVERVPGWPVPTRPNPRHRLGAAALTVANLVPLLRPRMRRETWRFLCHETMRESYWEWEHPSPGQRPVIGASLRRLAARDPATARLDV